MSWLDELAAESAERLRNTPDHLLGPAGRALKASVSTTATETVLEHAEEVEPDEPSHLIHIYCGPCLEALNPEKILPACRTKRPRNNDQITFKGVSEAPPREVCVVCLHSSCPVCGKGAGEWQ